MEEFVSKIKNLTCIATDTAGGYTRLRIAVSYLSLPKGRYGDTAYIQTVVTALAAIHAQPRRP